MNYFAFKGLFSELDNLSTADFVARPLISTYQKI